MLPNRRIWRALDRNGRRYALLSLVSFVIVTIVATIDILFGDGNRGLSVFCLYLAGLLLSLLASGLIGVMLSLQRFRLNYQLAWGIASLFGIDEEIRGAESSADDRRIALVLPAFDSGIGGPTEINVRVGDTSVRFGLPEGCRKYAGDTEGRCLVRHDVILASEIASLLARVGVVQPLILDDVKIVSELKRNQGSSELHITTSDDRYQITTLIILGLWSNILTYALAASPEFKLLNFEAADPPTHDSRRLLLNDASGSVNSEYSYRAFQKGGVEPAVLMRIAFADLNVVIAGGITARGTVRLGDYLRRDDGWRELTQATTTESDRRLHAYGAYWFGLHCPGEKRGRQRARLHSSYATDSLRELEFAKVVNAEIAAIPESEDVGSGP
jgi:hypothetical protein